MPKTKARRIKGRQAKANRSQRKGNGDRVDTDKYIENPRKIQKKTNLGYSLTIETNTVPVSRGLAVILILITSFRNDYKKMYYFLFFNKNNQMSSLKLLFSVSRSNKDGGKSDFPPLSSPRYFSNS